MAVRCMCCRVAEFDSCLNSEVVDLEFLREQSYRGIPEGGGRRATSWRILLGYLPVKRKVWREVCQAKRDLYKQLVGKSGAGQYASIVEKGKTLL